MSEQLIKTERITGEMLAELEKKLQEVVSISGEADYFTLYKILSYHMGWEEADLAKRGKRIRPLLLLLTNEAAGGRWNDSLDAACAVELLHNFSLIHDDIEDNSPLRRGRPTIWKKWGTAIAINSGDALFSLSFIALSQLSDRYEPDLVLAVEKIFNKTCLLLTQGQHLDISYEEQQDLSVEAYWPMVRGKTAALLASSTEMGALLADVDLSIRRNYRNFGHALGLAFQVQDDILGIWGDSSQTGKSNESDLVTGKKSLPILYGLSLNGPFAKRWYQAPIRPQEVKSVAKLLEDEGGLEYTKKTADRLTRLAYQDLESANPIGPAGAALFELVNDLLGRKS
jgi:geranylgeranyl diphosphate synthase, type I